MYCSRLFRALGVLLALCLAATSATALDYFGHPDTPPAADAPATPRSSSPFANLPAPLRQGLAVTLAWQGTLNAAIREQLQAEKQGGGVKPALLIVLFSFLYGVFHALGPGHGKVVVGSYFLTRRARILQGLAMSGWAAFVQSMSAIVLVGGLAALLNLSARRILDQAAMLEAVSYGAMTMLGLTLTWRTLRGEGCGHSQADDGDAATDDAPPNYRLATASAARGAAGLARHDACGCPPIVLRAGPGAAAWKTMLTTGTVVGLRPCTGAILVLLFCLANELFPVGVLATFAMGVGVALTVTAVSLASLGMNRLFPRSHDGERRARWHRVVSFAGAAAIALFGLLQLLLAWTGQLTPMAG